MNRWLLLALILTTFCGSASAVVTRFVPRSFLAQKTPRINHASSGPSTASTNACAVQITRAERAHGIPGNLMQAISKVESGRRNSQGTMEAWPWTVNAEGKGYYYDTKAEALAGVKELQAQGVKSIDVGCMQVNLYHHPKAFNDLEAAFDPAQNVRYAAQFLKNLNNQHNDWDTAVAHYHSATPAHHIPYHGKVMAMWDKDGSKPGIRAAQRRSKPTFHAAARSKPKTVKPRTVASTKNGSVILAAANRPIVRKIVRNAGHGARPLIVKGGSQSVRRIATSSK
jgi:hypothetical protein